MRIIKKDIWLAHNISKENFKVLKIHYLIGLISN